MGNDRKSILFVENLDLASPLGCTVAYYLVTELADSHTVHAICRRRADRRDGEDVPEGVELHSIYTGEIPVVSGLLYVLLSTLYAVALSAVHRYDVVFSFQNDVIQGWLGARAGGSKFVVGLQSVPVRQTRDFVASTDGSPGIRAAISMKLYALYAATLTRLLESAAVVVCLTDGIRGVTEDVYSIDLSDAPVIGMGVDADRFAGGEPRPESGSDAWTMTYVGTITPTRRIDHVIEAVAALDHDVELRIAGTGPDDHLASLEEKARTLGVAGQVEWLGLVPHEEIPELLRSTDVAVSPLADIESYRISFPAKLLEYMAAGCPVVATDIPPHRRLIDDGENGLLYDGSTTAFVRALETCFDGEQRQESISCRARETAREYDWDVIVGRYEDVLFDGDATPTGESGRSPTSEAGQAARGRPVSRDGAGASSRES